MLNDLVERSNRARVLLVLITKSESLDHSDVSTTDVNYGISPRRLADLFCNASPAKAAHSPITKEESLGVEVQTPSEGLAHARPTTPMCKPGTNRSNGCSLSQVTALMTHPSLLQKRWYIHTITKMATHIVIEVCGVNLVNDCEQVRVLLLSD